MVRKKEYVSNEIWYSFLVYFDNSLIKRNSTRPFNDDFFFLSELNINIKNLHDHALVIMGIEMKMNDLMYNFVGLEGIDRMRIGYRKWLSIESFKLILDWPSS